MNAPARTISLLGCAIIVMLALAIGSFGTSTAIANEPPDDEKAAEKVAERDHDSDRGPLAGPKGPRHKVPPSEVDDEGEDEPREMRPPRRRGEFGPRGENRRGPRHGKRGRPFDGAGPPHRGRGPGRGFPPPRFELTEEIVREVMAFLRDKLPDWHEKLDRLHEENPRAFRGALRRVIPLVEEYKHLQETNPQLAEKVLAEFRIEHKLRKLAKQYTEAKGDAEAREKLETQIAPLVREQLEIRFMRHEAKLDEMQKRIARGREKLERDRANIDKTVAKRMKQIEKGKFRERGRDRGHKKFRGDRKDRRGFREGRRGPRGDDDDRERPRRGRPAREPEDEL